MSNIFQDFGSTINNFINPQPTSSPDPSSINIQKPRPDTNADPNIAAQTSVNTGTDINNATNPLSVLNGIFSGITQTVNNSIMQRGNGWLSFDSNRWANNYYYRFLILKVSSQDASTNNNSSPRYDIVSSYKFPLNPESVIIETPYAIKLTITSDGAFEEHNGTPIKNITISGTTGIMPNRTAYGQLSSLPGGVVGQVASAIAPNSVRAVSQTIQSIGNLSSQLGNLISGTGGANSGATPNLLTGYAQFQLLKLFLDGYATLKVMPNSQQYRLALYVPKDGIAYLITPGQFRETLDISSPFERKYSFPMTAWGTANINGLSYPNNPNTNTFGLIKSGILKTLTAARTTLNQFNAILPAVKSDYQQTVMGPLNLAILVLKGITGQNKTVLDYGGVNGSFVQSAAPQMILGAQNNPNIPNSTKVAAQSSAANIQAFQNNTTLQTSPSPIVGGSGTAGGQSVTATQQQGILLDPYNLSLIADATPVTSIPLSAGQTAVINQFEAQVALFGNKNFQALIDNMGALSLALEGPAMNQDDYTIQYALNDAMNNMYGMISTSNFDDSQTLNALQYWQVKSQQAGINFATPNSKFSVPFPPNGTLEWLAQTYLGDPTRWMEIAAINNLQPPYVDEAGFTQAFISNGFGNQFNIADKTNLYDGQSIILASSEEFASSRTILAIQQITPSNFLITVDGANNLSSFKVSQGAFMQAYLPFTVNSQSRIYIPSVNEPAMQESNTPPIPYLKDNSELVQFSKIDWLLTSSGDLACTPDGFVNLAVGANNLVQAARLKVITSLSSLLLHPNYGNPVSIGDVTANVDPAQIMTQLSNTFAQDPRFGAINSLTININGPTTTINMDIGTTFNGSSLPVTFDLQ